MARSDALRRLKAAGLTARGQSIRAHWKREFPKDVKKMEAEGRDLLFFLEEQERYEHQAADLRSQVDAGELPPSGDLEILTERFYPTRER